MLTVFIVPSHRSNANIEKTMDSFEGLKVPYQIVPVQNHRDINKYGKKNDWFAIFWDNEYLDEPLKEAIPVFLQWKQFDVLILYKKESMVDASWRYRIFRSGTFLVDDFRPISLWLNREVILDGWILEHVNTN